MKGTIHNSNLETNLKDLARLTVQGAQVADGPVPSRFGRLENYFEFEKDVRLRPEFTGCTHTLASDPAARSIFGKLVGTVSSRVLVDGPETCLVSFLYEFCTKNEEWSEDAFSQAYGRFEDLFYSSTITLRSVARLSNFRAADSYIDMGEGIAIRREPLNPSTLAEHRLHHLRFNIDHVLERVHEEPKVVGDESPKEPSREYSNTVELFDGVIVALRVLKTSGVYRDQIIDRESITFHPHSGLSSSSSGSTSESGGPACELNPGEVVDATAIFSAIRAIDDKRFQLASRRLSSGMAERTIEDSLIDFVIGLESLYLPNVSIEVGLRLSLRVAKMLETNQAGQRECFEFIRDVYDGRSKLVHGEPPGRKSRNTTAEDVSRLEEILRKSLRHWLNDRTRFAPARLRDLDLP